MKGPNLYNELIVIVYKMSEHQYMKADMAEMFHQLFLLPEDTEAFRFVLKHEGETEETHYKMLVLCFGVSSGPALSQYVRNVVAKENAEKFRCHSVSLKRATIV
jgi:hypothetical protein